MATRALKTMVRVIDPVCVFLIETKVADDIVHKVAKKIGFTFFISVPPIGNKGGLLFFWRLGLNFDIIWMHDHIIHLLIQPGEDLQNFFLSLAYGPSVWTQKEWFWDQLRLLGTQSQDPWVCLGDLNDVLKQREKRGGRDVRASSSRGLAHFMESCGMVDLGFSGCNFTWSNKRPGLANIRERIDRGIANVQWRMTFPNTAIQHYEYAPSDHVPLILNLFGNNCLKGFGQGTQAVLKLLLRRGPMIL